MFILLSVLTVSPYMFEAPVRIEANGKPIDVTTGHSAPYVYDFDGDGVRDLLVGEFGSGDYEGPVHQKDEGGRGWANGRLRFYKNNGTDTDIQLKDWEYVKGGGEVAVVPITCCVSFVPQFVDYNNDGIDDIVSGSYPGDMYLFLGNGDGTYQKVHHLLNEDGDPLVAWELIPEQYRARAKTDRQVIHSITMELHDMDDDGDLDIFVGSRLDGCFTIENIGSRSEPVWSNQSHPLVSKDGSPLGGWDYGSNIHFFDWDNDGISDILIGSESAGVRWCKNIGKENNPSFESPQVIIEDEGPEVWEAKLEVPVRNGGRCKVHATDWDGDGLTDLLVGDFGSTWTFVQTLTPEQEQELKVLEKEAHELGELAMPLWNMNRDLTPEETAEKERLDALLNENYTKQRKYETHSQQTHGWVWLYKQKPQTLATQATPHVKVELKKTSDISAGKPFSLSVIFNIDKGWSMGSAGPQAEGLPSSINVSLPEGFSVKTIDWPSTNTRRGKAGYKGLIEVDVKCEAPSTFPVGTIPLEMEATWQVCSDATGVCKMGNAVLHASVQ